LQDTPGPNNPVTLRLLLISEAFQYLVNSISVTKSGNPVLVLSVLTAAVALCTASYVCCLPAGLLYQPGDYAQAAQLVQSLLADRAALTRIAKAGRQGVELFGWSAATRVLREQQYARAVRLSIGKRRFWLLALRVRLACMFRALLGLVAAVVQAAVGKLDYAGPYRAAGNSGHPVIQ
jgi:hypothetical protein